MLFWWNCDNSGYIKHSLLSKQVDYSLCTEVTDSTTLSNSVFLSGFQLTTSHVYVCAHLFFHNHTPMYMYPYLTQCESHTSPMRRYRLPSFSNDSEDSEQKEVEEFSLSKVPSSLLKQVGGLLHGNMLLMEHKLVQEASHFYHHIDNTVHTEENQSMSS